MPESPQYSRMPIGTTVGRRPTTLSARAAERLANGPLDALTLMRDVCRVDKLQRDAAERMAEALLSSHEEFVRLPSGHWSLTDRPTALAGQSGQTAPTGTDSDASRLSGQPRVVAEPASVGSLADVSFAVVDVETTGTRSGNGDRVTEIAIAHVQHGRLVDVYSQLINPERMIPAYISSLTHITWDMVKDQPAFRHIANDVSSRLAGRVFVAHNAAFDWRFVSDELGRGGVQLSGPKLCTVRLARMLLPQLPRRSLDHVTRYFGIDITGRHRAAGDAEATAHVLLKLLRIAEQEGMTSWPLLEERLASPSRRRITTAADRRRRAFPHSVTEDHSA